MTTEAKHHCFERIELHSSVWLCRIRH